MTSRLPISRRDFLNGMALGVAAGGSLSPLELLAQSKYPPALTGMRGSHAGSFEVAHALAWGNARWPRPESQTDDTYDLVVAGGGLSGLSAAYLYRQRVGPDARILILDNHDDFGGHAKRNEFEVDGESLICYGGSQSIDTPGQYSGVAKKLLRDIAIETDRFYDYFDRDFFRRHELGSGIWFSREKYGRDSVHANVLRLFGSGGDRDPAKLIASYPLSETSKRVFIELLTGDTDYLADKSRDEKIDYLRGISYLDYLSQHTGATEQLTVLLRDVVKGYWGIGYDCLSALEGYRLGMPGTANLGIGRLEGEGPGRDEPYIFHFPDGNAGIARALVRQLVPGSMPGNSMEDLVLAKVDYDALDLPQNDVRVRLNSTVVDARHATGDGAVDITYVRDGRAARVRAKHAILACYNNIIPHLCPELPDVQRDAIDTATKIPLVYISVAVRNWRAFANLGYQSFYIPDSDLMHSFGLDFPVSMGGYQYAKTPDDATVIHGTYAPTAPGQGLDERQQHVTGRRRLYEMSFADFETGIVRQMSGALGAGGFDAERDVAAITVNRWPHGYAYEYNELYDPPDWNRYNGPHLVGARQIGRISIANSDAAAYAYVNGAIDAADRAVNEQIAVS